MRKTRIASLFAHFALVAAGLSAPVLGQAPRLSLEHRLLVRCSAAFALVANGQDNGNQAALAYPDITDRAREYFVRASAQVMDEAGLGREDISAALSHEAQDMLDKDTLDDVMQVCLPMLPPAQN